MVEKGIYPLNNTGAGEDAEEKRLNFQHNVFLRMTENELIPAHISAMLPDRPRVADIATGTATWLRELAGRLPNAQLEGFDMTDLHYPPPSKLPANITLHKHSQNVLEPFPTEFQGKFDVVHVRLLLFALKANEWDRAVANASTLLRPGGWLHWEETGYTSWVSIPPSRAFHDFLTLDLKFAKSMGRSLVHPVGFERKFANAGLEECGAHTYHGYDLSDGADDDLTEAVYRVMVQTAHGILAQGGVDGLKTEKDVDTVLDALTKARKTHGQQFGLDMKWVWGRKPN